MLFTALIHRKTTFHTFDKLLSFSFRKLSIGSDKIKLKTILRDFLLIKENLLSVVLIKSVVDDKFQILWIFPLLFYIILFNLLSNCEHLVQGVPNFPLFKSDKARKLIIM